jgi:hypothetical protein
LVARGRAGRRTGLSKGPGLYRADGGRGGLRLGLLALVVIGLGVVVVVAAMSLFGGGGCSAQLCPTDEVAGAPRGYELVSKVYAPNPDLPAQQPGTVVSVEIPLLQRTNDGRNLSFYRYAPETATWEPISPALLTAGGEKVSGTFDQLPAYLAVARRVSRAGHVVAYLPHGATLHSEAIDHVTILHTLDFKPAGDGKLVGQVSVVERDPARQFVPVISANQSAENGALAAVGAILSSAQSRTVHVREIVMVVTQNNLDGVDIAYLDLAQDQRTSFTLFVAELAQALHARGKILTLTLPPPARGRDAIDEGAYDWGALGQHADVLQITPYRDQGDYRLVMPRIFEYLAGKVEPHKLVLTVSPLATEKSADGLRTMTLVDAMRIAARLSIRTGGARVVTESNYEVAGTNIDKAEGRSGVQWSPETACVFFTYEESGGRTMYIENVFSIGFKLEYIPRYKLGGVAVDDASANPYLGNIWPALVTFIATGQPSLVQPNATDLAPGWVTSAGDLDGGQRGVVKWRTPATPGTYTVTLTLSDGVARFQNTLSVDVEARDTRSTAAPAR